MTENEPNLATDQSPAPASGPENDPGAAPEDAGLPEYADDETPTNRRIDDPQRQAMPVDHPLAMDDYGVTAAEARHREPLDARLAREVPDDGGDISPGPTPYEVTVRDMTMVDPGDPDADGDIESAGN